MIYLTVILFMISVYSLYDIGKNRWKRHMYKSIPDTTPQILISTIHKHSRWSDDKAAAQNILDSHIRIKEYKALLEAYSKKLGLDNKDNYKKIRHILQYHETIASDYYNTSADTKDRATVSRKLGDINEEVKKIEADAGITLKMLKNQKKIEVAVAIDNYQSLIIHKENLRKCDIVRLYNHKATPLRDLSTSLVGMLENIGDREGKETQRLEILKQLKDISEVLDSCVEALPTYDSNSFIENQLKINRNLLKGLKNAEYVDTLQINTDKI